MSSTECGIHIIITPMIDLGFTKRLTSAVQKRKTRT